MTEQGLARLIKDLMAMEQGRVMTQVFCDSAPVFHFDWERNYKDDGYVRMPDGTETVRRMLYEGPAEVVVSYLDCERLAVIRFFLPDGCPAPAGKFMRVVEGMKGGALIRHAITLFDQFVTDVNALSPCPPAAIGDTRTITTVVADQGVLDVRGRAVAGL